MAIPQHRSLRAQSEDGDAGALRDLRLQARALRPLDARELEELLAHSARGDRTSQDRLVAANLGLVIGLAESRQDQGLSLLDLIQEGSIGLVEAVRTFPDRNLAAFVEFAEARVEQQMDAALAAEAAAVRDVQRLVEAATDYERIERLLLHELHRKPTQGEIAEKLEWTVDRTRYVAEVVAEARRRHDEELLEFIDPEAIDFDHEVDQEVDQDESAELDA